MDLQLPVQSVPITTEVVSLNHAHGKMYSIQLYVLKAFDPVTLKINRIPDSPKD
jgi:hypothetical protein